MTILQALAGYYDRMKDRGEAEPPGFSRENISFSVVIDEEGTPIAIDDLRDTTGKKPVATKRDVPASFKRPGTGISPFFLWDTSAYVLGVDSKDDKRTPLKLAAFRELHIGLLGGTNDPGLLALRRFLEGWTPERFAEAPFTADMLDANIVFRLDGDEGGLRFIHERPAALPLIEARGGEGEPGLCLVTGVEGPIARLHPAIKGVDGAQTMGAALVSFNLDAFSSWGNDQGGNAPTGQAAAARYGAALNRLLDRGGNSRLRIGDATVVFWADANGIDEKEAHAAEDAFASMFAGSGTKADDAHLASDAGEARKVREALAQIAEGRPAELNGVAVTPGVEVHILGLSPNAARLSVRFWLTERLETLAANLTRHERDWRIEPLPWKTPPTINVALVNAVAAQGKWDNIPPLLAGEMARAVLHGTPYPRTLLSNAIMRLRAGDDAARGWHAAAIRAVLMRSGGGAPVSLDKQESNAAYRLGRLFAVLEDAQKQALKSVNATIRDRYYGAASAAPASVFPLLLRGVRNHVAKLRKGDARDQAAAVGVDKEMGLILDGLGSEFPRALKLEDQGRFAIGYYHQRSDRFRKKDAAVADGAATQGDTDA